MRSVAFAILLLSALASRAGAYDQRVHELLSTRGYAGPASLAIADADAVKTLRERLWKLGSEARDPALRKRFLARFPTVASFDAWAMKELFALNPDKHVVGFDDDAALPTGTDARGVFARASRLPDDDERNRDRFRHDAARVVEHDRWSRPLPDDPATLEMGALTGLSSQAHAHYGLPQLAFSDEPDVLKRDPRRFAVPPTVHTFGADFAESYTLLALLALHVRGGERLALTHAGAAAHHIEDVANQIHTVQVGLYDFFVDAKIQSLLEELRSAGGLLRPRAGFVSIGIDIISNHHVLAESLYAKHLLDPADPVAKELDTTPADPELERTLAAIPTGCAPGFGRAIARAVIDRSSFEGPEVYRAIRAVAQRRWSHAGQHFGDGDDPDAALIANADLAHFYQLQSAGARRGIQALHAWWARFDACRAAGSDGDAALAEALLGERLDALELAEARARLWTPAPPAESRRNWLIPIGYLVVIVLLALGTRRLLRRTRRAS